MAANPNPYDLTGPDDDSSRRYPAVRADILPMRRRHLRSVLRIEALVYPRPWSHTLFLSELTQRATRAYFVAKVRGSVVGYYGLMLVDEDAHITTVAVDPSWHRHKIATRMLLHAARTALQRSSTHLTLEVRVSNEPAKTLYRQFGFEPVGIRRNYYVETGEDALVMWARNIDEPAYLARLAGIAIRLGSSEE